MEAVCNKCSKRKSCKIPCYPVEQYLKGDSRLVYEVRRGNTTTVFPDSNRVKQRTSLSTGTDKDGNPRKSSREAEAFSTENDSPFTSYEPKHKQTSVFIKRFFGQWTYKDIATAEGISVNAARSLYHGAAQQLLSIIIEMDAVHKQTPEERRAKNIAHCKKHYAKNKEKINAERRRQRALNGDEQRARDRAHYARNKEKIRAQRAKNRAKVNARRRELYAAKKAAIN